MATTTNKSSHKLHFIVIPLMAAGHLIPMVDLSRLLAEQNNLVTIVTTPANAVRFTTTIDRAAKSGLHLRIETIPFPATGLPSNCENVSEVGSGLDLITFFTALPLMENSFRQIVEQVKGESTVPVCIVSDFCHSWTRHVARELKVPRFVFYSVCCFTLYCHEILPDYFEKVGVDDEMKPVVVPQIPHPVVVTRKQAPSFFPKGTEFYNEAQASESTSDGIIVNTFFEMEPTYIDLYQNIKGRKTWAVGPVALCNKDITDTENRGSIPSTKTTQILTFLDSMGPKSVIYVSLGSLARITSSQAEEIASGLEESGHPFIWVVRSWKMEEIESWLKETKFEERNRGKGLIIKEWAPQVMILSHPSVGGFITHCGWNSTMEGITAGLPMVTWPCFSDQFLNEKVVVDVVRTGVTVGVKEPVWWWEDVVLVKREMVTEAVKDMMGCTEEAMKRRTRAYELGKKAKMAMDVDGSSMKNIKSLIEEAVKLVEKTKAGEYE